RARARALGRPRCLGRPAGHSRLRAAAIPRRPAGRPRALRAGERGGGLLRSLPRLPARLARGMGAGTAGRRRRPGLRPRALAALAVAAPAGAIAERLAATSL